MTRVIAHCILEYWKAVKGTIRHDHEKAYAGQVNRSSEAMAGDFGYARKTGDS